MMISLPLLNLAQEKNDTIKIKKTLNEVKINALRAGEKTPVTFTNISKSEIESQSWGSLWHWLISVKIRAVADDFIQMNKKIKIYSRMICLPGKL